MVLEGTTGGNNGSKGNGNKPNGSNGGGNEANEDKAFTSPTKDQLALMLVEQNIEKLFTDQFDDAYAAVRVDEHIETLRIKSSRFASWIARLYYIHTKNVLGTENTKNVKSVLEAHAVYDGEKRKLYLRVGSLTDQKENGAIYYDLANKEWSVVKITTPHRYRDLTLTPTIISIISIEFLFKILLITETYLELSDTIISYEP